MIYKHLYQSPASFYFSGLCPTSVFCGFLDSVFVCFASINHRSKLMAKLVYISPVIQYLQAHENDAINSPSNPEPILPNTSLI